MHSQYAPATYHQNAFNCPICNAYAHFTWADIFINGYGHIGFSAAQCSCCNKITLWNNDSESLVFPLDATAPHAHPDLPEDCINDFEEARAIFNTSPRGAAALLRLCIQKLCVSLGGNGHKIDEDIAGLVGAGLPVKIQRALDIVRVIGNNAVHPGQISIEDKPELAYALFDLINMIVDNQISQPREVDALFQTLPEGTKVAIEKRDRTVAK